MNELNQSLEPLEIWLDGACRVCRLSQKFCETRAPSGRFQFRDFRVIEDADLAVVRAAHQDSLWLRDENGTLFEGYSAWRRIMAELPGWRWIATIAGIPPARWIGPSIYRLFARFRFGLPSI